MLGAKNSKKNSFVQKKLFELINSTNRNITSTKGNLDIHKLKIKPNGLQELSRQKYRDGRKQKI